MTPPTSRRSASKGTAARPGPSSTAASGTASADKTLQALAEGQARIEAKLDALIDALAEEGDEEAETVHRTLDGHERRTPANGDGTL